MPSDNFDTACDRLSNAVDTVQFERLRWARHEGPMLARMIELAQAAIEQRPDFELTEEGSSAANRRFVVKVHSNRVIAINLGLADGRATASAEGIERARYRVEPGAPIVAEFDEVDAPWMTAALGELFSRVRPAA